MSSVRLVYRLDLNEFRGKRSVQLIIRHMTDASGGHQHLSFITMIIAFDIETIPDLKAGEILLGLQGIEPEEAAKAMLAARRVKAPDAVMLPLHQQQIVAISVAVRWGDDHFRVQSLGNLESDENELVKSFFRSIDKSPVLVTWNGNGFDLPVLQYRALIHSIQSVRYWDTGSFDNASKWNNYQSRYHEQHIDLMDVLARYGFRGKASLDDITKMIGLPGKIGIGGEHVFAAYLRGELAEIRNYCEIDALNTYLVYLRFQYIRGFYTKEKYIEEQERTKNWLAASKEEHFLEFSENWQYSTP